MRTTSEGVVSYASSNQVPPLAHSHQVGGPCDRSLTHEVVLPSLRTLHTLCYHARRHQQWSPGRLKHHLGVKHQSGAQSCAVTNGTQLLMTSTVTPCPRKGGLSQHVGISWEQSNMSQKVP